MKILDNGIIKDKYDCVIIGAGNGGLNAAALLANRGVDVLVVEQHYIPGGAVTALRRQDCTCDIGAAILFGFMPEGYNPHYIIMNELQEPIQMVAHDNTFCMEWEKGKRIVFWKDVDKFIEDLTAAFPSKREDLEKYYEFCFKIHKAVTGAPPCALPEVALGDMMKMFFKAPATLLKVLFMLNKPGVDVFNKYLDDQELKQFFDICLGLFTCTTMDETPSVMSTLMFADMHKGGACYPVGSPQMLPNKLERAIERLGGHIIQRQMVKEIMFDTSKKKPKAIGIRLTNGIEIKADYVVSNSAVYNLYGKLIPPELCPKGKIEETMNLKTTTSALVLYIGVDKVGIPEDFHNIEFLIKDKENFFNNYYAFIPSIDEPGICPPDMHSMTVIYPCPEVEEWPDYQSEEYNKLKEEIADKVIQGMEDWIPHFSEHIRFCEIATPKTLERFLMKYKGNVGGPAQVMGQHFFKRPKAKPKGFKNLFQCGDSTFMGEGVVASAASGVSAANLVLKAGKYGKPYGKTKFSEEENVITYTKEGPKWKTVDANKVKIDEKTGPILAKDCQWCDEKQGRGTCKPNCPAGIDVLNFMRRIESDNFNGAAKLIREMNPLGEICGAVCPAETLCESDCYRLSFNKPSTEIKKLQKWVCQQAGEEGWEKHIPELNGKKIAVIGAGPGGLSSAYFLSRLGYKVDIYEKGKSAGGLMKEVIPTFRLSNDTLNRDIQGIFNNPAISVNYGNELGKDINISDLKSSHDAILLATGLAEGKILQLQGIEDVNVTDALSFLREYKQNGSTNVKGKSVLVVGGGSVAADVASVAQKDGASKVIMACLESKDEMPALKSEVEEILAGGCELHDSWGPKEFKDGKLVCKECTSVFDDSGKFAPKFIESSTKEIAFDQVVMAVGQGVESSFAKYLEQEFGSSKLKVNPETQLIEGSSNIYGIGDITRGAGTIVQSVGDARNAAKAIHEKLS